MAKKEGSAKKKAPAKLAPPNPAAAKQAGAAAGNAAAAKKPEDPKAKAAANAAPANAAAGKDKKVKGKKDEDEVRVVGADCADGVAGG